MTDWAALTRGIDAALAGTDINMPGFQLYQGDINTPYNASTGFPGAPDPSQDRGGFWGANLIDAVNNGTLPISRLNDMATRVGRPVALLMTLLNILLDHGSILQTRPR